MSHAPSPPFADADVLAFADGQLAPEHAARVASRCAEDPELAARVAAIRAQNAALRDALDGVLAEPIPAALLAAATPPAATSADRRRGWLVPASAAAAALLVGAGTGWFGRDALIERGGTPTTFARQAAFAHALYATDVNRPVEIWAADEKRLVTWLTKRLGFAVHAPDLNGLGYALVGGRLVAGNERPTALFMYENADKQRLSLQVRKQSSGPDEAAFRYAVENGVGVFYWIDESCGYAISGNVDRAQLLKIAHVVYAQLAVFEAVRPK
jgi:anti-sigma factor RsiW